MECVHGVAVGMKADLGLACGSPCRLRQFGLWPGFLLCQLGLLLELNMGLKMGLALGDMSIGSKLDLGLGPIESTKIKKKNKIIMKTKTISYDKIRQLKITTTKIKTQQII